MITTREDITAPVSKIEIELAKSSRTHDTKRETVIKILDALNEKRDSYNGVVTSIIHVFDSKDDFMIDLLVSSIMDSIARQPMRFSGKIFVSKAAPRLTTERPQFVLDVFEKIFKYIDDQWTQLKEHEALSIQIIAIKAIRKAEHARGGRPTRLQNERIEQICMNALVKCDDATKVDTLSLMLESKSTTKPLEDKELKLFKNLFRDALGLQEPALRQIVIAQTNKLIRRIKDSSRVVVRDTKRFSDDDRLCIIQRYMRFLEWLIEFCFNSIYCNAYFGSFLLTISSLKLIIQHISFTDENLPIEPLFSRRGCYDSILSCLNDSFEENKSLALELLFSLPKNEHFISASNLECFNKIAYKLVASVNPSHSLTCQFIFKLIIGLNLKKPNPITKNRLILEHLSNLVNIVERGVAETERNFLAALKDEPIYPKLTCIRALLAEVDINDLESGRNEWTILSKRIVVASIEACRAVSTVVCNLNPETIGHLPMDLKPMDVDTICKTLNVSLNISEAGVSTITSQMLLISGWKTIKECSLSLGTMCERFWWPIEPIKGKKERFRGPNCKPILDSEDVRKIVDFFDHYLKNLRHRGAFEQAYNGFLMVTKRIWNDQYFKGLLIETLEAIIDDFRKESIDERKLECLKAYVTRRSAGLPFIVQAILNSEHKHDSKTLRHVLDCLFEVIVDKNSESYQLIHCLNILRALIKEHCLGEKVLPYIGKTFNVTLDSFISEEFPIRNCANMLLKAAVDRTFGVNRLRVEIHRRNQLSFERFFTECPNLHQKMLKYLQNGLEDERYLAAVHSVFIILFRLRPSLNPEEAYSARKIITPFIEPLLQLAYRCTDFKVRKLAARLSVMLDNFCTQSGEPSMINLRELERAILDSQEAQLSDELAIRQLRNQIHGQLSVIKYLVESSESYLDSSSLSDSVPHIVQKLYLSNDRQIVDCSIKIVLLELVEKFFMTRPNEKAAWLRAGSCQMLEASSYEIIGPGDPDLENVMFKYLTTIPLCAFPRSPDEENRKFVVSWSLMTQMITRNPDRLYSVNLQGSLIRYIRHLLFPTDDFVDRLMDELDTDFTAAHISPFDQLRFKAEIDKDRDILAKFCNHEALRNHFRDTVDMKSLLTASYAEFTPGPIKFTSRRSNTPRAIELLALICKLDSREMQDFCDQSNGEGPWDRVKILIRMMADLPDCDVKCLVLLYAGKFMSKELENMIVSGECTEEQIETFEKISAIVDILSDGDHCMTIRETCSEVLRLNLKSVIRLPVKKFQYCSLNLFSALIKLGQDENNEVRTICQRIIIDLTAETHNQAELIGGSRLTRLISLITTRMFDVNQPDELGTCFDLMMRIIFHHSRNYLKDVDCEKERLFDKTKLNTFADHVATIQCCLDGLQSFFANREQLVDLNDLLLPSHILNNLHVIDVHENYKTGDYSWRLGKIVDGDIQQHSVNNNDVVDRLISNIHKSLEYFATGYWNMLTDTDYTYHELLLYKQIAFLRFVLSCTRHKLREKHLIEDIKETMQIIVDRSCSTTMLCKCLEMINLTQR